MGHVRAVAQEVKACANKKFWPLHLKKNSYETFKTQNLQFIEYTYIVSN